MLRRLLLSYLLIITVAVGLLVVAIRQYTAATFSRYLSDQALVHSRMLPVMLAGYFASNQSWEGIQPNIDEASVMIGAPITLLDTQGYVVAATQRQSIGRALVPDPAQGQQIEVFGAEGTRIGTVYVSRNIAQERLDQAFLDGMTSALAVTALLVTCLALVLGMVFARSINQPLVAMARAAARIAQGDYTARVAESHRGEIAMLGRAFNQMAEGIGGIERLRRELVANVSHDLRTPLTVIRGYLEGLRSGQIADRRSAELAFEAMEEEVGRLLHMVEDLRQMSRYDGAPLPLDRVPLAAPDLFRDTVRRIAPFADAKRIAIEIRTPAGAPVVCVDPEQIGQALFNLVENSVYYTPEGGRIVLSAGADGAWAWMAVQDSGIGIAPEHLPHVFERFYRSDRARSSNNDSGLGLGLAIVRSIIEAHGGRVEARSGEAGQAGSTFTVYLPL